MKLSALVSAGELNVTGRVKRHVLLPAGPDCTLAQLSMHSLEVLGHYWPSINRVGWCDILPLTASAVLEEDILRSDMEPLCIQGP